MLSPSKKTSHTGDPGPAHHCGLTQYNCCHVPRLASLWSMGCSNHSQLELAPAARMTLKADLDVTSWAPLKAALGAIQGARGRTAPTGSFMVRNLSLGSDACGDLVGLVVISKSGHHQEDIATGLLMERDSGWLSSPADGAAAVPSQVPSEGVLVGKRCNGTGEAHG